MSDTTRQRDNEIRMRCLIGGVPCVTVSEAAWKAALASPAALPDGAAPGLTAARAQDLATWLATGQFNTDLLYAHLAALRAIASGAHVVVPADTIKRLRQELEFQQRVLDGFYDKGVLAELAALRAGPQPEPVATQPDAGAGISAAFTPRLPQQASDASDGQGCSSQSSRRGHD